MSKVGRDRAAPRERVLYFMLVPSICVAVLLLGAAALSATLKIERARQQTVFDATWSLAEERVDRLDKMIIAQDNAVTASVNIGALSAIAERWLPTARRETPTVRAILVLDLMHPDMEVHAFVSRQPGYEDDAFRRLLIQRMIPKMNLTAPLQQLNHLHQVIEDQSYLLSYWQRVQSGRRFLVVAWHDVSRLVNEVMPRVYRDLDRNSRMNVIDQKGKILYGPPIQAGGFTVGLRFPTTLYSWRLQVALTSAEGLAQKAVRQRLVQLGVVGLAMLIAVVGVVMLARASVQERRLASLKSDFVANVSHELKTPLASVRMFGEMLLTGRVANDEKRRKYLQIIVGESERLTSLIDNVLDFAKVERGKVAYSFSEGDVAEAVKHAVELLRYRAEGQGVELLIETESIRLKFDGRAIELAVINLVDNALKYASSGKMVTVRVQAIAEHGLDGGLIRVEDNGPGVAAEEQAHIFDRFVRGRAANEAHARGSGIGLALVKHIAESHGGHVRLESPGDERDCGCVFEIYIPRSTTRA